MRFETTQWSLVLAVGGDDPSAARRALTTLCETYWYPLYAYVRRRGTPADDARDVTQGFFASLLERRDLEDLSADRGRFRAFLLASLKHFLANQAARDRAAKRGGGAPALPLAFDVAERRYSHEPVEPTTPESIYERRWALTVIERVLADLREDSASQGRTREFEALKGALLGEAPAGGYVAVARDLKTTEGAVKVAVHRLRRKFQQGLRAHIAETVLDPAEVSDEIRYLIRALTL